MVYRIVLLGNGNLARRLQSLMAERSHEKVVAVVGRADEIPAATDFDLLVEVASPEAVATRVLPVVEAGTTVLIGSVGALIDERVRQRLAQARGRAVIATGAVGGLDHVRALAIDGGIDRAHLTSSKLPATLIQPWMPPELVARLQRGDERIVVASGTAAHVAELFPRSANVAAAVALAANDWERTTAEMVADPAAINTTHVISAVGAAGSVRSEVSNVPSPDQPRSSMIVAASLLRSIDAISLLHGASGDVDRLLPLL